jgi:two-component system cell cycle sensor histidine kinase/response regulator CckA
VVFALYSRVIAGFGPLACFCLWVELTIRVTVHPMDRNAARAAESPTVATDDRFRHAFAYAATGMAITDASGRFLQVNRAYCEIAGYSEEELLATTLDAITHPDDAERTRASLRQLLADDIPAYVMEKRYVRKDRGIVWVRNSVSLVRDSEGRPIQTVAITEDITEQKRIEESLRESIADRRRQEERLREAAKLESLGVMASGIAHDFNNLLTGILGNASMLWEDLEGANRELAADIMRFSSRAADRTRQLLAYSGKGRFVTQPIDLSVQVREVLTLVRPVTGDLELRLHLTDHLPYLQGDPGQIQQLIINLVTNAAESIDRNPGSKDLGCITISTGAINLVPPFEAQITVADEVISGRYVFLQIEDTGSGMSEETNAKIFDPFFTTKFTGRGLGLAAVSGIVRGHAGVLRLKSSVGQGSTFDVYFPAFE